METTEIKNPLLENKSEHYIHKKNDNWQTCFSKSNINDAESISIPFGLTRNGFMLTTDVNRNGSKEWFVDEHIRVLSEENAMFDFKSVKRIRTAIKLFFVKKEKFSKITSYGFKHDLESFFNRTFHGHDNEYVANGDFILAMALEGYSFKRRSDNDINCFFNTSDDCSLILQKSTLPVSEKSVELFKKEGIFLV